MINLWKVFTAYGMNTVCVLNRTHRTAANKLSPICVIVQPFLASLAPTNEGRDSGVSLVDFGKHKYSIKNESEAFYIDLPILLISYSYTCSSQCDNDSPHSP